MMQTLKRLIKATPLAGPLRTLQSRIELRHLPDGEYREQRDDLAIRDLMARTLAPDSACVDVGTNRGRMLAMMLEHAPRGQHIAVEPIPHLALSLAERFPGVKVHCCALSNENGSAMFNHIINRNAWSGLKEPWTDPGDLQRERIPVALRRLDDLVPGDLPVRFIKIDVEGAELQVLTGGVETIRRSRPFVVFEYGELHSKPYGTTSEMIYDFLTQECGLTVRSLLGHQPRLTGDRFLALCRHATTTHYDRASQGNFLATPD